jgi:lysophospholipase L1-like esterase
MNVLIRQLAADEGALLVDLWAAFSAEPDQRSLFKDHLHPSVKGREIMVRAFFEAITGQ